MATLTHLPHLTNMQSGINKWDPSHSAVYELYFTLPDAIRSEFSEDEVILTEQVTEVSGLDQLTKTTPVNSQKFMGVDVSHHGPAMENTYADITVTLNLNLRNKLDNFVLKVFRAWENLNYNLADGTRTLLADYSADAMRIADISQPCCDVVVVVSAIVPLLPYQFVPSVILNSAVGMKAPSRMNIGSTLRGAG